MYRVSSGRTNQALTALSKKELFSKLLKTTTSFVLFAADQNIKKPKNFVINCDEVYRIRKKKCQFPTPTCTKCVQYETVTLRSQLRTVILITFWKLHRYSH